MDKLCVIKDMISLLVNLFISLLKNVTQRNEVHRGLLTSKRVDKLYVIMATTYSLVTLSTRPLVNTSTRQLTLLNTLI